MAGVLYGRLVGDAVERAAWRWCWCATRWRRASAAATLRRMLGYGAPLVPVAIAYGVITSVDRFVLQRARGLEDVGGLRRGDQVLRPRHHGACRRSSWRTGPSPSRARARPTRAGSTRACSPPTSPWPASPPCWPGCSRPRRWPSSCRPRTRGPPAPAASWLRRGGAGRLLHRLGRHRARAPDPAAGLVGGRRRAGGRRWPTCCSAPRLGPLGAGIATTLAYVTSAVLTYALAQRVHPVPFRGARLALVFALALALTVAGQRLAPPGGAGVLVKVAVALAFAAAALALGLPRTAGRGAARPRPRRPGAGPEAEEETEHVRHRGTLGSGRAGRPRPAAA